MQPQQPQQPHPQQEKKHRVLVIGAGFAGLSVAYHLREDPRFVVTVVEARDRIGGRVWPFSLGSTSTTSATVQLGGQWIHEPCKRHPIVQLLRQLNIPLHKYQPKRNIQRIYHAETGQPVHAQKFQRARKLYRKATDFSSSSLSSLEPLVTQDTSQQDLLNRRLLDTIIKDDNDDAHLLRQYIRFVQHEDEMHEGAQLCDLSVTLGGLYQRFSAKDEEYVAGGYGVLINALVQTLCEGSPPNNDDGNNDGNNDDDATTTTTTKSTSILLNSVVETIRHTSTGVQLVLTKPQNGHDTTTATTTATATACLEGDYCVCTVPLGVLQRRRITFDPDLPSTKWNAIDSMGMGTLNKVVLLFDCCFWGNRLEGIGVLQHPQDDNRLQKFYDGSDETGQPVLYCFYGGASLYGPEKDDATLVDEIMQSLRRIFETQPNQQNNNNDHVVGGGVVVVPNPLEYRVTRWQEDPFAYGSYSYTKVGCTANAYDELTRPMDRLRFAGEATSTTSHATVHGAWMTGEREAKRFLQELSK